MVMNAGSQEPEPGCTSFPGLSWELDWKWHSWNGSHLDVSATGGCSTYHAKVLTPSHVISKIYIYFFKIPLKAIMYMS